MIKIFFFEIFNFIDFKQEYIYKQTLQQYNTRYNKSKQDKYKIFLHSKINHPLRSKI